MKIIFTGLFLFFTLHQSFSQQPTTDSSCSCKVTATLHTVSLPESEEKYGTVVVEFSVDSVGILSKATVIQSLGPEYDKEALRFVNEYISKTNACLLRCKYRLIRPATTFKQPVTFNKPE